MTTPRLLDLVEHGTPLRDINFEQVSNLLLHRTATSASQRLERPNHSRRDVIASWLTAGAADRQSDGQQMPPNFDDVNRRGAGWENSPPAEPPPRSQPRNSGAAADFGSGRPASDLDTQATAIRSTEEQLRRLDQAERDVKDDQDHLENLLNLSQAVLERQLTRYSEMVAIGLTTPESVTTETRLGAAIINEIKRRLADLGEARRAEHQWGLRLSLLDEKRSSSQKP